MNYPKNKITTSRGIPFTNEGLARIVSNITYKGFFTQPVHRSMVKAIQECPIEIEEFYKTHNKSLGALESKGIGPKTKEILESILSEGIVAQKGKQQETYGKHYYRSETNQTRLPDDYDESERDELFDGD